MKADCHLDAAFCVYSSRMPEWLPIVLVAVGYIAIMKWVLPRLGIPT